MLQWAAGCGRISVVLLSMPLGDGSEEVEARLALEVLQLEPVMEARCGAQRMVPIAVDVMLHVLRDYGWRALMGLRIRPRHAGDDQLRVRPCAIQGASPRVDGIH